MTAPLLHWLLVVCGLAGVTVLRFDDPKHVVSLWIGTVAGTALGHLAGFLRLRIWFMIVIGFALLWLAPLLLMLLDPVWRQLDTKTLFFAALPAFVCAFASLSERGGLLATWFPTVLWMIVVLDGPSRTFDARAALPFVVGLGALFVASLHARESRRVAIWRRYATVRLATPLETNVLRESPLRSAVGVAWAGLVGVGALVIAAWIAPHLWKKEADHRAQRAEAERAMLAAANAPPGECCHVAEPKRERVAEYLALRGHEMDERPPCGPCKGTWQEPSSAGASGGDPLSTTSASDDASGGTSAAATSTVATVTPPVAAAPPSPPPAAPPSPPVPATKTPEVDTITVTAPSHAKVSPDTPNKTALLLVPARVGSAPDTGTPWRAALVLGVGVLLAQLMLRMVRREITMRHLERPFWRESIDQRVSNHWQRMLVGLRDAGIRPAEGEQPMAFARRVGIEGMSTCAEILERVRHGVRLAPSDLDAMSLAATTVYSRARARAGVAGRAVGWVRSPLA